MADSFNEVKKIIAAGGGLDKVILIALNNSRHIYVTKEMKENNYIVLDEETGSIKITEENFVLNSMSNFQPRKVTFYHRCDFVEYVLFDNNGNIETKPFSSKDVVNNTDLITNSTDKSKILNYARPIRNDISEILLDIESNIEIEKGKTQDFTVTIDNPAMNIYVISGNGDIVTVSEKASLSSTVKQYTINAVAYGRGTIVVRAGSVDKRIEVKVVRPKPKQVNIVSYQQTVTVLKDATYTIGAVSITPSEALQDVVYTVDKPELAYVSSNGIVTFTNVGTVKVTVSAKEDLSINKVISFNVRQNPTVKEFTITPEHPVVNEPITYNYVAEYYGDATEVEAVYSDTKKNSYDKPQEVTVTLKVKDSNNNYSSEKSITFNVDYSKPTSISVSNAKSTKQIDLHEKQTDQIGKVSIIPSSADQTAYEYISNDTTIATVNETGLVTFTQVGNAVISVRSTIDNTIVKEINYTVVETKPEVVKEVSEKTEINMGFSSKSLAKGSKFQLKVSVTPKQKLTYESSNEEIATVDENGLVEVVGDSGQSTIKAIAEDGTEGRVVIKVKA